MKKAVHIHLLSLGGGTRPATVIFECNNNNIIVEYKDSYYSAFYDPFTCAYYVDDIFGELSERAVTERIGDTDGKRSTGTYV